MTEKNKKRFEAVGFIALVLVIIWLLLKKAPVNLTDNQSGNGTPAGTGGVTVGRISLPGNSTNISQPGNSYTGGTYNIGGAPSLPAINLQLLYPQYSVPTSSCDCGCSANDPINAANQTLATFITQYQDGVVSDLNQDASAATSGLPAWLSQYISIGGGAFGGALGS